MKHFNKQSAAASFSSVLMVVFWAVTMPLTGQVPEKKVQQPIETVHKAIPQTKSTLATPQTLQKNQAQIKPLQNIQMKKADSTKMLPVYSFFGNQVQAAKFQPATSIKLKADQSLLIAKTGNLPEKILPKVALGSEVAKNQFYSLPETYYARLSTGKEATLNLVYSVERPLKRLAGQQVFNGALSVFLQDSNIPGQQQSLKQPVILEVTAPVDHIAPERISLTHTNLPSTSISFQAGYPADSVAVRLITSVHTEGYTTYLPVLPALDFPGSGQSLQGWGLEQIPVTIQLRGITGQQTYSVALEASDGSVNPTSVTLRGGEPQTVHFRSRGLQGGVLRANNPLLGSAETPFTYRIPFAFMIAALLGGMVGGYFRFSSGDGAQGSGGRRFLSGMLGGILGAGAYSLGVNLLGNSFPTFPYFSEIVTFVVAALAGGALSYFTKGKAAQA